MKKVLCIISIICTLIFGVLFFILLFNHNPKLFQSGVCFGLFLISSILSYPEEISKPKNNAEKIKKRSRQKGE